MSYDPNMTPEDWGVPVFECLTCGDLTQREFLDENDNCVECIRGFETLDDHTISGDG